MPTARKEKSENPPAPGFTRRVQRTGSSSLSITLPKAWTDSMNLETGDTLRFRDLGGGRLEISPANAENPADRRQKLLRIDASDAPPKLLARLLIGAYITGQDQIVVSSRTGLTPEQRQEVRRTVAHVLGMTVVEEESGGVEIQNFVDPASTPSTGSWARSCECCEPNSRPAGPLCWAAIVPPSSSWGRWRTRSIGSTY